MYAILWAAAILVAVICSSHLTGNDGVGYQQTVAKELELCLKRVLIDRAKLVEAGTKVSANLSLKCDLALARSEQTPKLMVEIEFRPNCEKDIIKFMIAERAERLAAGVLIVVNDRKTLNARYTTMPQFSYVKSVLDELAPSFPLLLIGLNGDFS